MRIEDCIRALAALGYESGYVVSVTETGEVEFPTWEHDAKAPTLRQLKTALSKIDGTQAEVELAQAEARESALGKLAALGLTVEEIEAAFNIS